MNLTPHDVILAPIYTEQAHRLTERENKYTFRVNRRANKIQIRQAVEELFHVKVRKVHTLNVMPKRKGGLRTRTPGFTSAWKKAIVTVAPGESIELV